MVYINSSWVSRGFRSWIKLQIMFQHQYNFLLLIFQDRKTVLMKILSYLSISCIYLVKASQMHWQLKQTFQRQIFILKVTLEVALGWKFINHKELLPFLRLTISIGLIIKRMSPKRIIIKKFIKYQSLLPESHQLLEQFLLKISYPVDALLNISQTEGDNRKLKKVQELQSILKNFEKIAQVKKKL